MTTQLLPYNWLRTVSPDLKSFADIPLVGYPPPFNWQNCTKELSQLFNLPDLELTQEPWEVKTPDSFLNGFEKGSYHTFTFSLSPLEKEAFLLVPDPLINQLIASMTGIDPLHYFVEKEFSEGFNEFVELSSPRSCKSCFPTPRYRSILSQSLLPSPHSLRTSSTSNSPRPRLRVGAPDHSRRLKAKLGKRNITPKP